MNGSLVRGTAVTSNNIICMSGIAKTIGYTYGDTHL